MALLYLLNFRLRKSHAWIPLLLAAWTIQAESKDNDSLETIFFASYSERSQGVPGGLYAVRHYIYKQHGYRIQYRITPNKRMPFSLRNKSVESFSSSALRRSVEHPDGKDGFVQAKYPDVSSEINIYYKRSTQWQPTWPPERDFLENARGVTINYNYLNLLGLELLQVADYDAGLKMVNFGRADFWIDGISERIPAYSQLKKAEADGYTRGYLLHNPLFLTFVNDARGRELKRIFDEGYEKLLLDTALFREVYMTNMSPLYKPSMEEHIDYLRSAYIAFEAIE